MNIRKKLQAELNNMQPPKRREYILFFILFLIPFASMMYGDMKAFTHYEVNFWGSIFEGGINNTPKTWSPETGLKKP